MPPNHDKVSVRNGGGSGSCSTWCKSSNVYSMSMPVGGTMKMQKRSRIYLRITVAAMMVKEMVAAMMVKEMVAAMMVKEAVAK